MQCYEPFIYRNVSNRNNDIQRGYQFLGDTDCIIPCPSPLVRDWDRLESMVIAMGIISFLSSLFVLFTYGPLNYIYSKSPIKKSNSTGGTGGNSDSMTSPKLNKRSSTSNKLSKFNKQSISILFLSFGCVLIFLTDLIFANYRFNNLLCMKDKGSIDHHRYARQSDGACFSTALIFQYGCMTVMVSWAISSLDLWINIKKFKHRFSIANYYILILIGIPLIFSVGPIIFRQYGYTTGLGCFILDLKYQNSFFWIPLGIMCFIGTLFILMILYEIYKVINILHRVTAINTMSTISDIQKKKKFFRNYLRPFLIIAIINIQFLYMLVYNYYSQDKTIPKYELLVQDYIKCKITNQILGISNDNCEFKTIPFTPHFIFLFLLRCMGIEVLIFYGLNQFSKKVWSYFQIPYHVKSLIKYGSFDAPPNVIDIKSSNESFHDQIRNINYNNNLDINSNSSRSSNLSTVSSSSVDN